MPKRKNFNRASHHSFSKRKFQFRQSSYNTRKFIDQKEKLSESDVGITQFISDLEGFSGVLKARYSDFQVNEVDLNGEVAKLTDFKVPQDFLKSNNIAKEPSAEPGVYSIPQDVWDEIKKVANKSKESTELDVTSLDREQRKEIHECLQVQFGGKICANTQPENDRKIMTFRLNTGNDNRMEWPRNYADYVHFVVYKEYLDTMEVSFKIAKALKMAPANLNYAGVKDKRAKTSQWFSVRRVHPQKLLARTRQIPRLKIGNIKFKDEPLKLGQLLGNQFRIVVRNVTGSDELIEQALNCVQKNGFINYYGLQRFGNNKEVPTYEVGRQLLLGHWKEACDLILKYSANEDPEADITKAKKIYSETRDAGKALAVFGPRTESIEYLLLSGLSKSTVNEYVNALTSVPRNTRLLYLHSFQSLIWNMAVSERINKFGLNIIEGDLVFLEAAAEPDAVEDEDISKTKHPIAVTADDCAKYTVFDLVLPLPGYDVIYPDNLRDFYKETLEKYGLSLEMPKQKVMTYTLSGSYRKAFQKVQDFSSKVMKYSDPNKALILSDLEQLEGEIEPEDVDDGPYKALILEFKLKSSSYATMLIREIFKMDTSSVAQTKLNGYHVTQEKPQEEQEEEGKGGLLSDPKKYELFKSLVFNEDEEASNAKEPSDAAGESLKPE